MTAHRARVALLLAVLAIPACSEDGRPAESAREPTATSAPAPDTTATDGNGSRPSSDELVLRTDGLGPLTLGMTSDEAVRTGLIGSIGPGCELGGTEAAALRPPLVGTVNFSEGRLESIDLRSGAATEEHVTPDATIRQIADAYDGKNGFSLKRIDDTVDQYGFFMLEASKGGMKYSFLVEVPETPEAPEARASSVSVPDPLFCE